MNIYSGKTEVDCQYPNHRPPSKSLTKICNLCPVSTRVLRIGSCKYDKDANHYWITCKVSWKFKV